MFGTNIPDVTGHQIIKTQGRAQQRKRTVSIYKSSKSYYVSTMYMSISVASLSEADCLVCRAAVCAGVGGRLKTVDGCRR